MMGLRTLLGAAALISPGKDAAWGLPKQIPAKTAVCCSSSSIAAMETADRIHLTR